MKKILVTGGAGFIGSHFLQSLPAGMQVVVLDDFSTGKRENLENIKAQVEVLEGCVTDVGLVREVVKNFSPHCIVHLAALASVALCEQRPEYSHGVNFSSLKNFVDLAHQQRSQGAIRFLFASSAAVYGDGPGLPKTVEHSLTNPISQYGKDKLMAEQYLKQHSQIDAVEGVGFRFFNVFGPRQDPSSPYSGVLSIFKKALMAERAKITIFGDGEQTRDFIFVEDVVRALRLGMEHPQMVGQVYNVGSGVQTSLNEVVELMKKISQKEFKVNYQQARVGDIRHSLSDPSALQELGWDQKFSFEKGLGEYLSWPEDFA